MSEDKKINIKNINLRECYKLKEEWFLNSSLIEANWDDVIKIARFLMEEL